MAITTIDGIIAGAQTQQTFIKALTGTMVAGRPISTWGLAGIPGAGSYDTTLNGVTLDNTANGSLPFTNPGAGFTYLTRMVGGANIGGTLVLCDRLWHNGGYTISSTSAQNSTTPSWPSRDNNASANGEGVFIGLEVSATTGSGTPTLTLNYTNSAGTASRSSTNVVSTVASSVLRTFYPIGLQTGDKGVRSVQSLTLSATWTSGTINLVAYREIARLALSNGPSSFVSGSIDPLSGGFPRIMDSSCLFFLFYPSTTTTSNITGQVGWTQG